MYDSRIVHRPDAEWNDERNCTGRDDRQNGPNQDCNNGAATLFLIGFSTKPLTPEQCEEDSALQQIVPFFQARKTAKVPIIGKAA
jgi:hypothetical protein